MSWHPERDSQLVVFRKNGQKLKYSDKGSTHTPGYLIAIPLGLLNHLSNLNTRKTNFNYERVDNVYPKHANALQGAGLEPPIFPTMGEFWKGQHEKWILKKKKNLRATKRKKEMYIFVFHTHVIFLHLSTG